MRNYSEFEKELRSHLAVLPQELIREMYDAAVSVKNPPDKIGAKIAIKTLRDFLEVQ